MKPLTRPIPLDVDHIEEIDAYLGPEDTRFAAQRQFRLRAEGLAELPAELDRLLYRARITPSHCTGAVVEGCLATRPSRYSKRAEWFRVKRRADGSWVLTEVFLREAPAHDPVLRLTLPQKALTPAWVRRLMSEKQLNVRFFDESPRSAS